MTFTSPWFYLFLPIVLGLYWWCETSVRWRVLLGASCLFYGSWGEPFLLGFLGYVTLVSYAAGLGLVPEQKRHPWLFRDLHPILGLVPEQKRHPWLFRDLHPILGLVHGMFEKRETSVETGNLAQQPSEADRLRILWGGIIACLLPLVLGKFAHWRAPLSETPSVAGFFPVMIGVSYVTFQAVSYVVDVYLDKCPPERHLGYHALALAFFPKLLQGPIERAGVLLPQLKSPVSTDYEHIRSGLLLFGFGLFRKIVVADRLGAVADQVFDHSSEYAGIPLWLGIYAYAFQIYFDFAGYTDMARGTARLFGIEISENFRQPYLAESIQEFWQRWHITFSRWIFEYLFNPLQMAWRHQGKAGTVAALLLTFLISGLWHGTSYGFLVWGMLHGLYLSAATLWRPYGKRISHSWGIGESGAVKVFRVFFTFHLVVFAWIFFRAPTLEGAFSMVGRLFHVTGDLQILQTTGMAGFLAQGLRLSSNPFSAALAFMLVPFSALAARARARWALQTPPFWVRWVAYFGLVLTILVLGQRGESTFLYFRF